MGRSVLSRSVDLSYVWRDLDVKRMYSSRPLGRKAGCATWGAAAVHVIFVPVHLNNLMSISRTVIFRGAVG